MRGVIDPQLIVRITNATVAPNSACAVIAHDCAASEWVIW